MKKLFIFLVIAVCFTFVSGAQFRFAVNGLRTDIDKVFEKENIILDSINAANSNDSLYFVSHDFYELDADSVGYWIEMNVDTTANSGRTWASMGTIIDSVRAELKEQYFTPMHVSLSVAAWANYTSRAIFLPTNLTGAFAGAAYQPQQVATTFCRYHLLVINTVWAERQLRVSLRVWRQRYWID